MKKTTKLIVILTVIAALTALVSLAVADDKIYTSPIFTLPKNRIVESEEPAVTEEPGAEPEVTEEPGAEPEQTAEPGAEPAAPVPVERKVMIYTSRKEVVTEGDIIELTGALIGFDDVPDEAIHFQWEVDRNDGAGWVTVEGATKWYYKFIASRDTILYNWRLIVNVDE